MAKHEIKGEPIIRLELTLEEFKGLYEVVVGKGTMGGAWSAILGARQDLNAKFGANIGPGF